VAVNTQEEEEDYCTQCAANTAGAFRSFGQLSYVTPYNPHTKKLITIR